MTINKDAIKFQSESPSQSDLFQSKGHEFTACSVASTLKSQPEISIIGLEGELGSGKSTIINLIKSNLSDSNFKFITFDVEKYHYSSTNASFIKFLHSELKEIVNKKQHEGLKEIKDMALGNILSYKKETDSNISPSILIFAMCVVFSLRYIHIPIDNLWEYFTANPVKTLKSVFNGDWGKSILALSPALYFIITWSLAKFGIFSEFKTLGNLLKKNGVDTINEKFDVTREIGSTELQIAIDKFISLVPKDTTLVLVIDNLDRVDSGKVKEVWSDLEIFTNSSGKNFRVILPFSSSHISEALSDKENNGHEYISKRLPVVYRCPPIVSASWRLQFEAYWNQALPNVEGADVCAEILDIWCGTSKGITPRFLKRYINDIAVILLTSQEEEISSISCAGYLNACKYSSIPLPVFLSSEPNEKFINEIATTKEYLNSIGMDKWPGQFASIEYQTTIDMAGSILLSNPIDKAIKARNGSEILGLSTLYGFDVYFEKKLLQHSIPDIWVVASQIDSMNENTEAWIDKWMPRINESTDTAPALDELDLDYIKAITKLKIRYKPRLTQIKKTIKLFQEKIYSLSTNKNDLFAFHHYSLVLNETPDLIKNPDVNYFYEMIWPNKNKIQGWDLIQIARGFSVDQRSRILSLIFQEKENIGVYNELLQEFIETTKVQTKDIYEGVDESDISLLDIEDEYLNLLPFSESFYLETNTQSFYDVLSSRLFNESNQKSEWAALFLIHLIATNNTNSAILTTPKNQRTPNGTPKKASVIAMGWIEEFEVKDESIIKYSPFVESLGNVYVLFNNKDLKEIAVKIVHYLIGHQLIAAQHINSTIENYRIISEGYSQKDSLLNWMHRWAERVEGSIFDLSYDFIEDVFNEKNTSWVSTLTATLDSSVNSSDFWVEYIIRPSDSLEFTVKELSTSGKKFKSSTNIVQAIESVILSEDLSIEPDNFEVGSRIEALLRIIKSNSSERVIRNLKSKIPYASTEVSTALRVIGMLNKRIEMPVLQSQSERERFIYLLEKASSDNVYEWFNEQNWGLESWPLEDLKSLRSITEEAPASLIGPLDIAIESKIAKQQDNKKSKEDSTLST